MMASTGALFSEAIEAQRRGDLVQAARLYRQLLSLDPRDEAACGNLAIIAAQQGDLTGAERLFRQSLALRPNPEGFNNLGMLLLQQGRAADAIAAHRHVIALRSDHAAAHLALGNALKQQGELEAALAAYREAVRLDPAAAADAHNNIGVVLQRQ